MAQMVKKSTLFISVRLDKSTLVYKAIDIVNIDSSDAKPRYLDLFYNTAV